MTQLRFNFESMDVPARSLADASLPIPALDKHLLPRLVDAAERGPFFSDARHHACSSLAHLLFRL